MENNIYDRIDVIIGGEKLTARPVEFEHDQDGNPVAVTKFETTCPLCGNAVQFSAPDTKPEEIVAVACDCKREPPVIAPPSRLRPMAEKVLEAPVYVCPFVDPLELGLMIIDESCVG